MTDLDDPDVNHERAVTRPHHRVPAYASTRYSQDASYLDVACDKLRRAAVALGAAGPDDMTALLRRLCRPWGDAAVARPRYWSNVSLEGMPFELSYAWGGGRGHELRMSFETLAEPPTPETGLDACRAFTRRLADEPGASISRYLAVEELFVAPTVVGMSPMAHGVAWTADSPAPGLKIYLNPNIAGYEHGLARTAEALERLGLSRPWRGVCARLADLGAPAPRPVVVAMDLAAADEARVKIYLPHLDVDADAIDRQAAVAANFVPGAFAAALRRVTGHAGPHWKKVPVTCLTLAPGADVAAAATLYVPLIPDLADDAASCAAVTAFVREAGGDPSSYVALLQAVADRPLAASATHNFVSYRPGPRPRFAVYLAPDVYRDAGGAA